ncbi:translin family protein [Cyclospora cayetanensis]|uniref:Translin family protein n=1 Tax=Cyclospora cayetanensis TaxID=88456 RepID=A0A1D3CS46_9EIME|nr:translin family protein [Cyclospora cayetanensis]
MAANPALIPGDRLDKDDFYKVIEEYTREDAKREDIIKKSRDVLKLSKQAIFALHRMLVAALEEYAEARIFLHFLKTRKLLPFKSLNGLRVEEFLGGLMDCTGELNRFAVLRATEHDATAVHDCCQFVGTVHEQMILLDLRNSPLRRKYDSLKYTQKRLEALVYELAVAARMQNIKLPSMLMEPEPETNANQE